MRKMRFGLFVIGVVLAASSTWSYASEIRSLAGDVTATFKSSDGGYALSRPVVTKLATGLKVYDVSGEYLGTTKAFTHRNGNVTKVWFGDEVASGREIEIRNGRLRFLGATAEINLRDQMSRLP